MPDPLKLSREIESAILEKFSVGESSVFCDESEWFPAERGEVAAIVDARIRPLVDAVVRIETIARCYIQTGSDRQRPLFWEIHDIAKSAIALSDPPEGDKCP